MKLKLRRCRGPWSLLWLFGLLASGCDGPGEPPSPTDRARLDTDRARLDLALRRAIDWAAGLDLHPVRLRTERRMKGIKHFVEHLDLLLLAHRRTSNQGLAAVARQQALKALAAIDEDAYHSLGTVDPQRFREDSMSYLRACWLAQQFGKDVTRYRLEIDKVLPTIVRHLPTRGVDQRMGFAVLFAQLGYPVPQTLESIYPETLLARRVPFSYYLVSPDRPYDITHEIFALTERGAATFKFPHPEDEAHARDTVRKLLTYSLQRGNLDLAGEFLVNLAELGESATPLAQQAREAIFQGQNADGSFGIYDLEQAKILKGNPEYDARIGGNLHTTMVCLWGLVETELPP